MSKSVDDAVCDYFSLLLNEPKVELTKVAVATSSRPEKEPALDEDFSRQALEQLFAKAQTKTPCDSTKPESVIRGGTETSLVETHPSDVMPSNELTVETQGSVASAALTAKLDTISSSQTASTKVTSTKIASAEKVSTENILTEITATQITSTQALLDKLDEEFQVLFFNVAGLTLAVPLVSLGGIVNLEKVTSLIGRPDWYLGVQQYREAQLNVVDTCAWVMPEKYDEALAQTVNYQYVVVLEDSHWGLGCESLVNTISIKKSEVNWRSQAGKRPWLAGVVKEQMCGILNVEALVQMLSAGMGCQEAIN